MKISIILATGLAVAAGAASVGALVKDQTGTGLGGQFGIPGIAAGPFAISGSDTLKPVVQQVLAANAGSFSQGFNYVGGGQSVSDAALVANTQQLSFGTASLKATSYINISIDSEATGSNTLPVQGTTEALLLGLDGLSILGNSTASGVPAAPAGVGLGLAVAGKSFQVFGHNADGTESASAPVFPGPHITGATDTNYGAVQQGDGTWRYTIQSSIDVIRLIYGGLHHNGPSGIGDFNANSDVRRSLADHWENIFNTGNAVTSTKLNHAYRRSDLAGTTNAFIALVGFGTRSLGALTGTNRKTSPFANDAPAAGLTAGNLNGAITLSIGGLPVDYNISKPADTQRTNINAARNDVNSVLTSNAGSGDQLDLDPIRRPAKHTGLNSVDLVASYGGTLGLVLPIFYPDTANITQAQVYPTILADPGAFASVPAGPNGFDTSPNGDTGNSQFLQPYWLADGSAVTGGNVATRHFELDTAGGGIHFHYVNTLAKGVRNVVDPLTGASLGDVDVAVVGDGTTGVHLAVAPSDQYVKHFNAISKLNNTPGIAYSTDDGRAYNGPVRKDIILPTDTSGAYVKDANNRELAAGFYKVRSLGTPSPASNSAFLPYAPNLQQTNSDFQTGALVANDPQSIGFTGRGVDTNPASGGFNGNIQALWLSGSSAAGFNSALSTPPADQNVLNLIVNTDGSLHGSATDPLGTAVKAAVYPLARRTYLATLVGFTANPPWTGTFNPSATASDGKPAVRGLQGDEAILAAAFGQSDNVAAAFINNGFVALPHASQYIGSTPAPAGNGGIVALDYPELDSTAATASFLEKGTGATPGGTNRNAVAVSPPVIVPYSTP